MAVNYGDYVVNNQYIIPKDKCQVVNACIERVLEGAAKGMEVYGVTLQDDRRLTVYNAINEALEEIDDFSKYVGKAIWEAEQYAQPFTDELKAVANDAARIFVRLQTIKTRLDNDARLRSSDDNANQAG